MPRFFDWSKGAVKFLCYQLPHERLKVLVNQKWRKCSLAPQTSFYAPSWPCFRGLIELEQLAYLINWVQSIIALFALEGLIQAPVSARKKSSKLKLHRRIPKSQADEGISPFFLHWSWLTVGSLEARHERGEVKLSRVSFWQFGAFVGMLWKKLNGFMHWCCMDCLD